jgi:hypothetical protein
LSLQRVNNVERSDCLALGVLSVCDGIADNTLKKGLENTSGLFVDHWQTRQNILDKSQAIEPLTGRDTLDTTTTSETSDRRLCDTLDVVTKNLAVTLRAALAKTLATFSACNKRRVSLMTPFSTRCRVLRQPRPRWSSGCTYVQS